MPTSAPPPAQPARPAREKTSVFISFRFSEALAEAKALFNGLQSRGIRTFMCERDVRMGDDLQGKICQALVDAKVHVLLATRTYGAKTNHVFSTRQELNFALDTGPKGGSRPFLIKMAEDWDEPETKVALGCNHLLYVPWAPGEPMPECLLDEIEHALARVSVRALHPTMLEGRSSRQL